MTIANALFLGRDLPFGVRDDLGLFMSISCHQEYGVSYVVHRRSLLFARLVVSEVVMECVTENVFFSIILVGRV